MDIANNPTLLKSYYIPPRPEVLAKVQEQMNSDDPNIEYISKLVSEDVGLSAAVLQIINSPLYGMNRQISDIKQAAMLLGLDRIANLVASESLKKSFTAKSCISLERFWDEATDIANAMVFIAERVNKTDNAGHTIKENLPLEDLYTLGLFHDCGIPPLAQKHFDYKELLMEANAGNIASLDLEDERYSTNHAIVGYLICTSWFLPKKLCDLVLRHHDTEFLEDSRVDMQCRQMFAILKAAEQLVYRHTRGKSCPEWSHYREAVFDYTYLTEDEFDDLYEAYLTFVDL